MGPISTGLGEIYLWKVKAKDGVKQPDGSPYTSTDLREIQDGFIKPQLRIVAGAAPVDGHLQRLVSWPFKGCPVAAAHGRSELGSWFLAQA